MPCDVRPTFRRSVKVMFEGPNKFQRVELTRPSADSCVQVSVSARHLSEQVDSADSSIIHIKELALSCGRRSQHWSARVDSSARAQGLLQVLAQRSATGGVDVRFRDSCKLFLLRSSQETWPYVQKRWGKVKRKKEGKKKPHQHSAPSVQLAWLSIFSPTSPPI